MTPPITQLLCRLPGICWSRKELVCHVCQWRIFSFFLYCKTLLFSLPDHWKSYHRENIIFFLIIVNLSIIFIKIHNTFPDRVHQAGHDAILPHVAEETHLDIRMVLVMVVFLVVGGVLLLIVVGMILLMVVIIFFIVVGIVFLIIG